MSAPQTHRKAVVLLSLVAVLTGTSALLMALCPAPLRPEAAVSLFNAGSSTSGIDAIFQTDRPIAVGGWTSIFIHQSKTLGGDARTLAQNSRGLGDHFLICNGDGAVDGEIQMGTRWSDQTAALPPTGASAIDPHCISICLVGDFDRTAPTPAQLRRAEQLVTALQAQLRLSDANVFRPSAHSAAGLGKKFSSATFLR